MNAIKRPPLAKITFCLFIASYTLPTLAEVSAHKDVYLLPFYKENKVNLDRFSPLSPDGIEVKDTFIQFQFSFKYSLLGDTENGLFLAYTQKSNWEAYADSAYFRDNDFNPEVFYIYGSKASKISTGLEHQSNGAGGSNEVSWNRAYINYQYQGDMASFRIKAWHVDNISDNEDIEDYLGNEEIEIGFKPTENQEIKLLLRNIFNSKYNTYQQYTWGFPIYQGFRGYAKYEKGYGSTISNYNFEEEAFGLGFSVAF